MPARSRLTTATPGCRSVETAAALGRRGVGFRSLTEAIDTTTSGGMPVFHLSAAPGQFGAT